MLTKSRLNKIEKAVKKKYKKIKLPVPIWTQMRRERERIEKAKRNKSG